MQSPQFAFTGNPLNRRAEWRSAPHHLAEIGKSRIRRWVRISGDQVAFDGENPFFSQALMGQAEVFLGEDEDGILWAAQQAAEHNALVPLRSILLEGRVAPDILAILAQARSLLHWHETHGFCAACGAASTMVELGYRRHCDACGRDHFPRTDPVVIMAVIYQGRLLLGRQSSWPVGMYSALAGFVEPGETLEEAAAREVLEEAGVRISRARYVASQPWPFPASLMVGMIAEAETGELAIDTAELEDARWFAKAELQQMLSRSHPAGLYATNPYAIAHTLVLTALDEL
jgi:NAD+ diphosphatase